MKIVLVKPPYLDDYPLVLGPSLKVPISCCPPLNLLYLATVIERQRKHSVSVLDATIMKYSVTETVQEIMRQEPDLVGLMGYTTFIKEAKLVATELRKQAPEVRIVMGGPHVDLYPQEILGWEEIDAITLKDAEELFPRLVDAIAAGEPLDGLPGVGFKKDGKQIITPPAPLNENLDSIPFPDRMLVPYKRYQTLLSNSAFSTPLLTSRGCAFKCDFCENSLRRCHTIHYRSLTNVVDEIESILALGIKTINIYDDSFCFSAKRVIGLCNEIIDRDLRGFTFVAKARIKPLTDEMLGLLSQAGCKILSFGLESGDDAMLRLMNKRTTVDEGARALTRCKKHGIATMGTFILGYPGETEEQIMKTIDFAAASDVDFPQFLAFTMLPGIPIYMRGVNNGQYPDYWADYTRDPVNFADFPEPQDAIPRARTKELVEFAYKRFYSRRRNMRTIAKAFSSPARWHNAIKTGISVLRGDLRKF